MERNSLSPTNARYGKRSRVARLFGVMSAALGSFSAALSSDGFALQPWHPIIFFTAESYEPAGAPLEYLQAAARDAKTICRSRRIILSGHSDSLEGTPELSKRRVERVRSYMLELGVPADCLVTKDYGAMRPLAAKAENRPDENRRVEIEADALER
jgi:hypothetical protein